MKKLLFLIGLLIIVYVNSYGQDQNYQTEIKLNIEEFQKPGITLSFLSYSGEFKNQTYMSQLILPEIHIKRKGIEAVDQIPEKSKLRAS